MADSASSKSEQPSPTSKAERSDADARSGNPAKRANAAEAQRTKAPRPRRVGNPRWLLPVMLGLMIFGLLWIVVFYISTGAWPIPHIGNWNLLIGFGIILIGFGLTTQWH